MYILVKYDVKGREEVALIDTLTKSLVVSNIQKDIDIAREIVNKTNGKTIDLERGKGKLLAKLGEDIYSIVMLSRYSERPHLHEITRNRLKDLVNKGVIENVSIEGKFIKIESDVERYITDDSFRVRIEKKYKKYIHQKSLLGRSREFEYTIIGDNVRLDLYKGDMGTIEIPSFVTLIASEAFWMAGLRGIKMYDNIKGIGKEAFAYCNLHYIEIPKSVPVLLSETLHKNTVLFLRTICHTRGRRYKSLDKNKVVLRNRETLIMNQV